MKKKGVGENLFPTQGRSTENGGFRTFEGRNEEFRFHLEDLQYVFIVSLAQGLHEVVAGFGQTTEENEGFGRVEGGKVGASAAEECAGVFEDVQSDLVALFGSLEHVERGDRFGI